jgi:hypothetical protein
VISVVVGGEVRALRNTEEGCSIVIDEMPIHVSTSIFLFQYAPGICTCEHLLDWAMLGLPCESGQD